MVVQLPDNTNTTIYRLNQITHTQRRGKSIPMSRIGDPCHRRLWYDFHWAADLEVISNRLSKIFMIGSLAEQFITKDLEYTGIFVTKRQEELWGFGKHVHGFTDGRCENVPEAPKTTHVLEIKTHNTKNFAGVVKDGVKKSKPMHYAQCQRYMIGLDLTRCLYVALNKDTSEYYVERIRLDKSYAKDLLRIEREIVIAEDAPRRIFERSWHECKWCKYQGHCFDDEPFNKNCRTCKYSDPANNGQWLCTWNGGDFPIPLEVQATGCEHHHMMVINR
jgi:hypothetical protein